jgi:hypothetical protein
LDQTAIRSLVGWLGEISGVPQQFERPDRLSIHERACDDYRLLFLINWSDEEKTLEVGGGWRDAFSGEPVMTVAITANDLKILRSVEEI